jgi:hypothetical protein
VVATADFAPSQLSGRLRSSAGPSGVTCDHLTCSRVQVQADADGIWQDEGDVSSVGASNPRTTESSNLRTPVTGISADEATALLASVRLSHRGVAHQVPDPLHPRPRDLLDELHELCEVRALVARVESQLPPRSLLPRWIPECNSDAHAGEGL